MNQRPYHHCVMRGMTERCLPVYSMIRQGSSRPPPPLFPTAIVAAAGQHRHLLPCCPPFTAAPISDLEEDDVIVVRFVYGTIYAFEQFMFMLLSNKSSNNT
nr:hypothetical protein [Tanacetum cinerariifolium]